MPILLRPPSEAGRFSRKGTVTTNARTKRNQSPTRRTPETRQKSMGPPRRNPPIRPRRLRLHSPRMAGHLLPPLGHLHARRRHRRNRRQKRRRQSRPLLHGPHPHPQRPPHQRTSPHHRRPLGTLRQRRSRHHRPPKRPTPLGSRRKSSRTPGTPLVRRTTHNGRMRRRHAQHNRLPVSGNPLP